MIALPTWLVTNALVVAGLYPLAWLLCRLCRSRPAVAHLVWLVLMVKLVAPPLLYWPWSLRQLADLVTPQKTISPTTGVNEYTVEPTDCLSADDGTNTPVERI